MVFGFLEERQSDGRGSNINMLVISSHDLFTCFPQKLWKAAQLSLLFALAILLCATSIGCSSSKQVRKGEQKPSTIKSANLLSLGTEEVAKKLGEPTTVSKTPEGRVFWVYEPKWKLLPDYKGTLYVEFEGGKVVKAFKTK